MKTIALLILIATTSFAAPPKALEYDFKPPVFAADQHGTVFHYYLPPQQNFAANVNLMAQPYEDTLEAYDELSRGQFTELGLELIAGTLEDGVLTYEYKGKMQGLNLRWYSRAIKQGDSVLLITATALASRWEADSPALLESVNSFRLKQAE